jgi:hypothetical protein
MPALTHFWPLVNICYVTMPFSVPQFLFAIEHRLTLLLCITDTYIRHIDPPVYRLFLLLSGQSLHTPRNYEEVDRLEHSQHGTSKGLEDWYDLGQVSYVK